MTELVTDRASLAAVRGRLTGRVATVLTMGALHDGHAALFEAAAEHADHVLATIFVNPLQFGPHEDFDRYPRSREADLELCARHGVAAVFAPEVAVMYPDGQPQVRVNPGPLGEVLEGASRPGFFHGVLTVVLKLLQLTRPAVTCFGEKDYQQLTLVRRMCRDLELPVEVLGVPTRRDPDGLARSSRNAYLSVPERAAALALSAALRAGAEAGPGGAGEVLRAAGAVLAAEPAVKLDYLELTDPELGPAPVAGPARLLVAGWVGATRLIDNGPVEIS